MLTFNFNSGVPGKFKVAGSQCRRDRCTLTLLMCRDMKWNITVLALFSIGDPQGSRKQQKKRKGRAAVTENR